jgi:hypothetical protein
MSEKAYKCEKQQWSCPKWRLSPLLRAECCIHQSLTFTDTELAKSGEALAAMLDADKWRKAEKWLSARHSRISFVYI